MVKRAERFVLVFGLSLVLGVINLAIWQKENLIADGVPVSLALAPVDPRSLMQGDYMALDWAVARDLAQRYELESLPHSGLLVLRRVGQSMRADLVRLDDGKPLAVGEFKLAYKIRGGRVRIVTDAFYFQEGQGQVFERARYGDVRVNQKGQAMLVGMQDQDFRLIAPAPPTDVR